jgi:predicted ATPase
MMSNLPVRRVSRAPHAELDAQTWPANVPCVRQVLESGFEPARLTVLVGENGSGKSTLVEGIAQAFGLSPEGGSVGARHTTRASESPLWNSISLARGPGGSTGARHSTRASESPLHRTLRLRRGVGASRWGFFLRAETMHGFYTYLEQNPGRPGEAAFHELSHGESFLELLGSRFADPGLYVLDEPEAALSFSGCLALVGLLHRIATSDDKQAIVATHSPIVAATPGARIVEVGDWGMRDRAWDELELVLNWQAFLDGPDRYLRHVLD